MESAAEASDPACDMAALVVLGQGVGLWADHRSGSAAGERMPLAGEVADPA